MKTCHRTLRLYVLWFVLLAMVARASALEPFENVTEAMGLVGLVGGVAAWIDVDNDGYIDLYVSGKLWRNLEGKRFELITDAGLSGSGTWADFDNDGFIDMLSWEGSGKIFRNVDGKRFDDIGDRFPRLPEEMKVSLGAAWGDFDGDGFVDAYVGGYETWGEANYIDVIVRNLGDGRFEQVWQSPDPPQPARGITTADYNEDGHLDVYVSNYRLVANRLWQNDGSGKFRDVAIETNTAGDETQGAYGHTIGSAWGDLDNDGHLDLFVGNFSHPPDYQDRPKFLRNLGPAQNFRFQDMSAKAGLHWQESYASPTLGDFDNDGRLDLFFTTVYAGDKSVLYRNAADWRFENVSEATGVDRPQTYQAAWGDFDNDGYLDLVTGGVLFRNPGGTQSWIMVRLVGADDFNRSAVGAQARVRLGEQILTRQVETATGQSNQNDMRLHFGLGDRSEPVTLIVRWPDGHETTRDVPINTIIEIRR